MLEVHLSIGTLAPEQKRFPLPPMQLREVFSNSLLFYLPEIKQVGRGESFPFIQAAIFFG